MCPCRYKPDKSTQRSQLIYTLLQSLDLCEGIHAPENWYFKPTKPWDGKRLRQAHRVFLGGAGFHQAPWVTLCTCQPDTILQKRLVEMPHFPSCHGDHSSPLLLCFVCHPIAKAQWQQEAASASKSTKVQSRRGLGSESPCQGWDRASEGAVPSLAGGDGSVVVCPLLGRAPAAPCAAVPKSG